ncbi:MAG: hypothetical protein U1C56_02015 [Candidatus Curtissbacteria bacterium]|nr:hypothetical protein [bacterium]MDZ4209933.1 hypothetical protein [Candidatus Curtissbacteria bacterium]
MIRTSETNKTQYNQSGLLISFDGIDSSGKETQAKKLTERLRFTGHIVHRFETPDYSLPSGQELKRKLQNLDGPWPDIPWEEKMRLFARNRAEHRDEVIKALREGAIVIYDRYIPSSLAFMTIEALKPQEANLYRNKIHEAVTQEEYIKNKMPHEDLSIILDVPPTVSSSLLEKRKEKLHDNDEYTDHIGVQQRLYNEYDLLCEQEPRHFLRVKCVIDNELLSIDDTSELVWEGITQRFPQLK